MARKFLRQDYMRHSRLGNKRKKLQKWNKAKGRHSKMRQYRKGYPASPSIGYKKSKKEAGKIKEFIPILINNINELRNIDKKNVIIIAKKVGARKKLEIIKKAEEKNIKILNVKMENKNEIRE